MPHKRLFTNTNPVLELQKHNMALTMSGRASSRQKSGSNQGFLMEALLLEKKETGMKSRARSKTPNSVSTAIAPITAKSPSREGTKGIYVPRPSLTTPSSAKLDISQSRTRPVVAFTNQNTDKTSRKMFNPSPTETMEEGLSTPSIPYSLRRKSETPAMPKLYNYNSRRRSQSIPPVGTQNYSISTIVKARSLAMKWYGNSGVAKNKRQRRRQTLPTITDDSAKVSLCANVQCSPQFAEVVKLLDEDVVDDTAGNFKLLKLVE